MNGTGRAALPSRSTDNGVTDEDLLEQVGRGDRAAARQLMERRLPAVIGLANRMLNDAVEAEDVAQDTFIRVWKAADRWESGRAKVSTWITRIAMNLCYDRLRRRREVLTDEVPERADGTADQETQYARGEASGQLADAIAKLPERQRAALELVHFQEMTNIEAAELMDVSVEAMESLLSRGRRKLKSLLLPQADDLMAGYRARGHDRREDYP